MSILNQLTICYECVLFKWNSRLEFDIKPAAIQLHWLALNDTECAFECIDGGCKFQLACVSSVTMENTACDNSCGWMEDTVCDTRVRSMYWWKTQFVIHVCVQCIDGRHSLWYTCVFCVQDRLAYSEHNTRTVQTLYSSDNSSSSQYNYWFRQNYGELKVNYIWLWCLFDITAWIIKFIFHFVNLKRLDGLNVCHDIQCLL
jgi:hypothetical protein